MIIGLTGPICGGKRAMAKYLREKYGFIVINLLYLFKHSDDSLHASPKKRSEDDDTSISTIATVNEV